MSDRPFSLPTPPRHLQDTRSASCPINVDLWTFTLERTPAQTAWLGGLCSAAELASAARLLASIDRDQRVGARGILRLVLASYLGVLPERIELSMGPYGKPQLAGSFPAFQFNLSHSDGMAALAVCREAELGVDIEVIRAIEEPIGELVLSPRELALLSSLQSHRWQHAFFCAWTRKEALVKAMGVGLNHPLSDIEVSFAPGKLAQILSIGGDSADAAIWSVFHIEPRAGLVGAIVVRARGRPVALTARDADTLLAEAIRRAESP